MALSQNQTIFIRLHPCKERRMVDSLFTLAAGIALLAVSSISYVLIKQGVLLHLLSIPVGCYVIWYARISYINPEKKLWPQIDTLRNLAGFIIIAHASGMFANEAGFQWSHLFIIIGAAVIFIGVMYPKEKNQCGFTISEDLLMIKFATLKKAAEIGLKNISEISLRNTQLTVRKTDGSEYRINLQDFEKLNDSVNELKEVINATHNPPE